MAFAENLIAEFEGFRNSPYWDVNAYRAGFGSDTYTTADGRVLPVVKGVSVSREDAVRDLGRRSKEFADRARSALGSDYWNSLSPQQQAALTSITYNYGSLPKRVVNAALSGGNVEGAIRGLGRDNDGINNRRRNREADIFAGVSGTDGIAQVVGGAGDDMLAGGEGQSDLRTRAQRLLQPTQVEQPSPGDELRARALSLLGQPVDESVSDIYEQVAGTGALAPRITEPAPQRDPEGRFSPDIAAKTAEPFAELTGQAFESLTGGEPMGREIIPDSVALGIGDIDIQIPEGVRSALGPVIDAGLTALGGLGTLGAGAAGLSGDVLEALGVPKQSAERFARDIAAMPEAFAGSPTQLARPGIPAGRSRARVPTAAAETIEEGARRGVRVMTTDVQRPRTFMGRWLQGVGEKIPVAGTAGQRAAQAGERVDAVTDLIRQYSDDPTRFTDDLLAAVSDDVFRENQKFVSRYAKLKNEAIDTVADAGPVPVGRTMARIDALIDEFGDKETFKPLVNELERWKRDIGANADIRDLDRLRSALGDAFKGEGLANVRDTGQRAVNSLYGPLREDIDAFVLENGGRQALNKLKVANRRLSANMDEVKKSALSSILNKSDVTPESVKRLLFSTNKSDVSRLYRRLSPEGRSNARAALLHEALEKSGGVDNISPKKFLNQLDRRARQTGIFFSGEDKKALDGFMRLMRATSRADEAAVTPPTGVQAVPVVGGAVATDLLGGAGAGLLSIGTLGGLSRLYESPAMRRILVKMSQAKPGSQNELNLMQQAIAELERIGPGTARAGQAGLVGAERVTDDQ